VIIVDTSVVIDFLRGRSTPQVERLTQMEEERTPFAVPAICCQEVLQGARDVREWNLLVEYLAGQFIADATDVWATHVASARIFFDCRRRGLTIRSAIDCFVAQLVLDEDGILLHNDEDFERIAKVRPLKLLAV
jgi:predicted nucleic acid-binding protein